MSDLRFSDNDVSKRDIPSFIEPRPPLIQNPFMRPRPQKGINLLEQFEEDLTLEEPELVQVYLRLKPCRIPNSLYDVRSEKCLVTSLDTATAGHGRRTQHNVSKMYTFSKIFKPECNQKELFEVVVKDNLKKLPDGHSFTLLTYGASGSGKTYTLMGTVGSPGLVPRSLEYVFRLVDAAQQPTYKPAENGSEMLNYAEQDYELQWVKRLRHVSAPLRDKYRRMSTQLRSDLTISSIDLSNRIRHFVWVSFVEIYNEAIYDLLAPPEKRTKLRIREDTGGNVYVKGATQAFVRSGEEAYDVMVAGKHNLQVAATGVHAQSSRSHCIFTITMLTETGDGSVRTSCVRLCDLAGCERARATRNTGARMAESRAINSSLHVLERCLHMLRRKQRSARNDGLVPYRESKLTRLLGTGLSGARGEAVSMVVTLNPSPEYAHETKHVLSLAAVAQDIQINNTMLVTTLESSSTIDTTVNCSTEVMKLRADNERLHFELVQAQSRNRELLASMEERQQESAITMRELVEEAKDMTKQYYEEQLEAMRAEMEEMIEEYESRLTKAVPQPPSNAGTPSRFLQAKVAQLMAEIAILEEKLLAEKLARARAEKEVEHLRSCIEERDEKAFKDDPLPSEDAMSVTDSDNENDSDTDTNDPFNESMEPLFKKELNRSVAIHNEKHRDTVSVHTIDNIEEEEDSETSDLEKSTNNTLIEDSKNSTYATEHDESKKVDSINNSIDMSCKIEDSINITKDMTKEATFDNELSNESNTTNVTYNDENNLSVDNDIQFKNESLKSGMGLRGTYFVKDDKDIEEQTLTVKKNNTFRGTYCVNEPTIEKSKIVDNMHIPEFKAPVTIPKADTDMPKKAPETYVNKIIKNIKTSQSSDSSLRQFEQLEMAANNCDDDVPQNQYLFGGIKLLKEKRTYFNNDTAKVPTPVPEIPVVVNKEKRTYFDNADVNVEMSNKRVNDIKHFDEERSPSIVKDIASENFEPSTIKKLLGENLTKVDAISSVHKAKLVKKHESVDMFEGYDSPLMPKVIVEVKPSPLISKDNRIPSPVKSETKDIPITNPESPLKSINDNIEFARKSIEQLVLNQSAKKAKQINHVSPIKEDKEPPIISVESEKQIKLETMSSVESIDMKPNVKKINNLEPESSVDEPKGTKLEPQSSIDDVKPTKLEPSSSIDEPNQTLPTLSNDTKVDNTIEEFENIYKDITAPRATEFELLISQEVNETSIERDDHENNNQNDQKTEKQETDQDKEDIKYNLRKKHSKAETIQAEKSNDDEILVESHAKCELKSKKRPLRLRRKKNQEDDDKLKNIVNLQSEFSDVTLDVPAPQKEAAKDIPSPEKGEEENLPPLLGIQSCPSKSVTRSRRKLFTPRAEPLEESLSQTGDSNERIYVPRPSYHRPRARRKL